MSDFKGAKPEPLLEQTEVHWQNFMRRFDEVVYPQLFEPRGIDKNTALLSWQLSYHMDELLEIKQAIKELHSSQG